MKMNMNQILTSASLRAAREDARNMKVDIPKGLTTYRHQVGSNSYYEVWADGGIVWQGSAWDANEAKSRYIFSLIRAGENNYV